MMQPRIEYYYSRSRGEWIVKMFDQPGIFSGWDSTNKAGLSQMLETFSNIYKAQGFNPQVQKLPPHL